MLLKKRFLLGFLCLISILIMVLITLKCLTMLGYKDTSYEYLSPLPFEAAKWKEAHAMPFDNDTRYRMHKDLLRQYQLIGLPKETVTELLGMPSETNYFKDWDLVYRMGPEPGFIRIDSIWLLIKLKDGHVAYYKIATD